MLKRHTQGLARRLLILFVLVACLAGAAPAGSTQYRRCQETYNENGECIWLCCPLDGSPCTWSYC